MPQHIIDIGASLVVFAGIIGAFYGGFTGRKSTVNSDANETIRLINSAKDALEERIAAQDKTIAAQDKRISELEAVNASYVKLFQGDPSQLEKYMHDTARAMADLATAQTAILTLLQVHQGTNVTINK